MDIDNRTVGVMDFQPNDFPAGIVLVAVARGDAAGVRILRLDSLPE